jgi:hypothetical protein
MMKRLCQIQRLEAKEGTQNFLSGEVPGEHGNTRGGRPIMVDDVLYNQLLKYAQGVDPTVHDYRQLPLPVDANILRPTVFIHATCDASQKTRVSVLQPNNCVVIKQDGLIRYGLVNQIISYTQPGQGLKVVCEVVKIRNLFCKASEGPTRQFRFWLYMMKAVVGHIEHDVELVPAEEIQNLAAYRRLPDGIFGLKGAIILTPVNRLGLLEINPVAT